MSELKSWLKDNHGLMGFLVVQALAIMTAGASILAYAVKLETRVSIMETRGAEYTVARMEEMKQRITVLEQKIDKNQASIERIVEIMTKNLSINPGIRP
jgi:uncharacterized coiled-coil protein SlyX